MLNHTGTIRGVDMADQKEATVNIDDKEYKVDELSEDAKEQLGSMRAAERQMEFSKAQLAIATTARNAYALALKEELAKDD